MDHNLFRDYCKAENTDDEEANFDLQSRLYAEIYYGPSDIETMDVKPIIKSEVATADNETLQKNESIITTPNPNDSLRKGNNSTNNKNSEKISTVIANDNKSNIQPIVTTSQIEPLHGNTHSQSNLSISSVRTVEHSAGNVSIKKDVDSVIPNKKNTKSNLDTQNIKKERNVAEPEVETESKEQLALQRLNPETPVAQSSCSSMQIKQEVAHTEKLDENSDNILTKYEFAKLFINKLYLKKYVDLEEKLQEMEKEKEAERLETEKQSLKEAERKEDERNKQWQQTNSVVGKEDEDSRYKVKFTKEKLDKTTNCYEEIVLSSETDSNSEDSILEVPIPPKPQPPVINLNDSDDSSDSSSSSDSEADPFTAKYKVPLKKTNDKRKSKKSSDINTATEDIVLNCTEVQKCASSIQEIREASKSVQSGPSSNQTQQLGLLYYPFSDEENPHDFHVPSKAGAHSNVVYERDKNKSINFTDDVSLSNFVNTNESSSNKRRREESDNEACDNADERGTTGNENKRSKVSPEKSLNNDETKKQTWEEYFFRPLPDSVKAFYNESRGQENFDIREIQNKMSKDPRLWTILDEDLMPELARQHRYWNTKCNYCQFEGHKRRNCPELSKPPRCHMCGSEGHTETRCPEKMCLTCGKKQGTFRKTCESCRVLYCNMCNAVGHKSTECPDHWRRFHQTTQNSEINVPANLSEVMKPADLLYCCNCTKRGHDSSTCNEYRWSQHFPTPAYVSNYTGGPRRENPVPATSSNSEDIIPLSKEKKYGCRVFHQGQDNLDGCFVVYSYGVFYTNEPVGHEIKKNLASDHMHASHLTNFFKGRIVPSFLDQLRTMVKFEIKIYYDQRRALIVRTRSLTDIAPRISDIFMFWLKLPDEEKHLEICTNIPRGKKKLIKFLKTKLEEIDKDVVDDPEYLCNQINQLKIKISNIRDPASMATVSEQLLYFQEQMMRLYHLKPKQSPEVQKLKKYLKVLTTSPQSDVPLSLYLLIIYIYNKIYLPRSLTSSELNRFLNKYNKALRKNKNKRVAEKKNEESKKQKKQKLSPYDAFIQNLKSCNDSKAKTDASNIDNSDAVQSTSSEKHNKQNATIISATVGNPAENDNVGYGNVTGANSGNVCVGNFNIEVNINESNRVYPKENSSTCVPSNSTEAMNTVTNYSTASSESITLPILARSNSKYTSDQSNLITVPIKQVDSPKKQSKKNQSSNIPSTEIEEPRANEGKSSETRSDSGKITETFNLEQSKAATSDGTVTKKKKSKKAKKGKTDDDDGSQVPEDPVIDPEIDLLNEAKKVILEALSFNLPHMNKAVKEIQKKINDKKLKREHIDVLQRLMNLEKDHQKYVSSFCDYLQ